MAEKTLPRFIARIVVSILGAILALCSLLKIITVPIFSTPAEQWANVVYFALVCLGSLLFYWSAFTNFDRHKIDRFF